MKLDITATTTMAGGGGKVVTGMVDRERVKQMMRDGWSIRHGNANTKYELERIQQEVQQHVSGSC